MTAPLQRNFYSKIKMFVLKEKEKNFTSFISVDC